MEPVPRARIEHHHHKPNSFIKKTSVIAGHRRRSPKDENANDDFQPAMWVEHDQNRGSDLNDYMASRTLTSGDSSDHSEQLSPMLRR